MYDPIEIDQASRYVIVCVWSHGQQCWSHSDLSLWTRTWCCCDHIMQANYCC